MKKFSVNKTPLLSHFSTPKFLFDLTLRKNFVTKSENFQPPTELSKPHFFSQKGPSDNPRGFNTNSRSNTPNAVSSIQPNSELGGLSNRRSGFGLVCLERNPNGCDREQESDEFSADVEKVYRILRKFHSRVSKLELALQASGVVMRSGLTERVLNRCGDAGNLGYSFFVWASKQPGYRHSYEVYKAMIKTLGKMRQFGAVWALIEEMRKENPQLISADVFVILMRRFASAKMVKKATEVLDEMPKYGCEPDEHVFGCLLDALCKNGSVKEAAKLFEDMRIRFKPTLKHLTSLLYGWCREGKLMEAKFVLIQMKEAGFEPDIVVYNNLLSGYAIAGKMADAYDLLGEMRRKGCEPNAASFTILIQALCSREKMEEAMWVFAEMRRSGCNADVVTYTTLISGFCKWGKLERGYELLDDMIQQGCTPNQMTYLHILSAHEKKEQLEECIELVEEMKKIGCFPDLSIYNIVIRLACKLGEVKEGVRFWNEVEASGVSPGLDTFTILIHGLLGQGCLIEACEHFKEMIGRGLLSAPQYGTLKELLNTLLRAEKLEMAKDVWSCIMSKGCELNVYAWTIWIHALFSNGLIKDACSYCLDMMDANVMPQPHTFAKLMKGLRKLYNRQIAAEITERVRKMAEERQFQLTVNVAALIINVVAVVSFGDVPLNAVQLLWVNLIMDTLGALALATEPPTDHLMHRPPVGRREPLITNIMWRNILIQAAYQVTVLLVLNFDGKSILHLEHDNAEHANKVKNTLIFNAIVFCQVFNEFNVRNPDEINIFKGVVMNHLFMAIMAIMVVLQIIIIKFLGKFASTVRLNWKYWVISIIGFISWPLAAVGKLIPVPETPFHKYFMRRGNRHQ
ncbi:Cation-transporting P-type ATPase, C-terminal [Dillenia turbinata]|uniref:P-type Ca(2+) transporter n=1 Tax=Dillenia turbinata TaxID=194707 RepID=A0AAN8V1V7_9MAGN